MSFLNLDKVRRDSYVCILNYKFISLFLIIYSGLLTSRIIFGEPIVCYGSGSSDYPSDSVSTSFCYMSGTFTGTMANHEREIHTTQIHNGGMDNHEKREHDYYQFMPLILALMSIGFYVPRCIWLNAEKNLFSEIVQDLKAFLIDQNTKKEQLQNLATFIKHRRGSHKKLFMWHFICQILYIANLLSQVYHLNLLFSGDFLYYGVSRNMHVVFPKVTHCDLTHYGMSGHVDSNPLTCFLPLNSLNDKVFLFIWHLMAVSLVLLLLNMLYTIIYMILPPLRNFVLKQKAGKKVEKRDVLRVLSGLDFYGKVSESFFMEIVCQNLSDDIVSELFSMI